VNTPQMACHVELDDPNLGGASPVRHETCTLDQPGIGFCTRSETRDGCPHWRAVPDIRNSPAGWRKERLQHGRRKYLEAYKKLDEGLKRAVECAEWSRAATFHNDMSEILEKLNDVDNHLANMED